VDLCEAGSLQAALSDVDVVVNAAGMEDPALAALIAGHGVPLVDIAATTSYVAALERLELPQPALFSVGLAPGLTNLLAAAVHATAPGPVDLVVPLRSCASRELPLLAEALLEDGGPVALPARRLSP
jgi:hypothetical protein